MTEDHQGERQFVVVGGGPAGLTAAYELTKLGHQPHVFEKLDTVGGLARTANYKGFHFDMGGHRFFTKVPEVQKMWHEVLPDDFLRRPRQSRIYYRGKFFNYPLKPFNALGGLGLLQSILVVFSYLRWHFFPYRHEDTFEQWVTNRFGRRLFLTFFKTYTEKVWGIPCSTLKAEWAAQRIKDLSLKTAVMNMFFKPRRIVKTLIEEFDYPRLGPGMMWNAVKQEVERRSGVVHLRSDVLRIHRTGNRVDSVVVRCDGEERTVTATDFISSMPITEFVKKLDPPPSPEILQSASRLTYRDFLTVCLIVNRPDPFPDNWIYIHSPEVKVGRIQNFKSWSPDMVPDPAKSSLGLEYFCTEGDEVWTMPDADLIALGKREVERIGLARQADVEDGCVVRVAKAYPVYDSDYREHLERLRGYVDGFENFQTIGRNGLHRYNNQDHAMLTGMLAVRNAVLAEKNDLWSVNTDQEYHEEIRAEIGMERHDLDQLVQTVVRQAFTKLDRVALGLSIGSTAGVLLFLATLVLVLKAGDVIGPRLGLLSQYFPGYTVTPEGAALGLLYGFAVGFAGGWLVAALRNAALFLYLAVSQHRAERQILKRLLEYF
jgi:protoporphyrinogen oxidase